MTSPQSFHKRTPRERADAIIKTLLYHSMEIGNAVEQTCVEHGHEAEIRAKRAHVLLEEVLARPRRGTLGVRLRRRIQEELSRPGARPVVWRCPFCKQRLPGVPDTSWQWSGHWQHSHGQAGCFSAVADSMPLTAEQAAWRSVRKEAPPLNQWLWVRRVGHIPEYAACIFMGEEDYFGKILYWREIDPPPGCAE